MRLMIPVNAEYQVMTASVIIHVPDMNNPD